MTLLLAENDFTGYFFEFQLRIKKPFCDTSSPTNKYYVSC